MAGLGVVPLVLLAFEGALRLVGVGAPLDSAMGSIGRLHRYSEVYGWEPRPGHYSEYGRPITINQAGYRGERVPEARFLGRRRVVVLGDSIAFGLYVGDGETYTARLGARRPDLEVFNLAVQGFGPGQSLRRLQELGLALGPDVVVLGLCLGNDLADAVLPSFLYDPVHPKPFYQLEDSRLVRHDAHLKLGARQRLSHWLQEKSWLFRALSGRSVTPAADRSSGSQAPWTKRRAEAMRDRARTLELVSRLVEEMRSLSEAHGATFLVLLHPDRVAGARAAATWEEALRRRFEGAGVESLSLAEAYEDLGYSYGQLTIDSVGHLNTRGHEVTATLLDRRLGAATPLARSAAFTDTGFRPPR